MFWFDDKGNPLLVIGTDIFRFQTFAEETGEHLGPFWALFRALNGGSRYEVLRDSVEEAISEIRRIAQDPKDGRVERVGSLQQGIPWLPPAPEAPETIMKLPATHIEPRVRGGAGKPPPKRLASQMLSKIRRKKA